MQAVRINDDGTTTIEFTQQEGRELRDLLTQHRYIPAAHNLQRLLAMAHGETSAIKVAAGPCTVAWHAHPDGQYGDTCHFDQPA